MASGVVTGDASVGTDTLRSIEFVRGSQFDDIYVATGFSGSSTNAGSNGTFNEFEGMGGNDTITGNGNTRIAFYNATAGVTVDLAAGTATGDASVGNDTFTGVNNIAGSQFADTLYGSNNAPGTGEQFEGRAGNDVFDGRGGFDTAVYNNDTAVNAGITVDMAAGTVTGPAAIGTDTLQGIEAIRGTNFADIYVRNRLQRVQHQCRQPRYVQRVRGPGRQRHHHRQRQHPDRLQQCNRGRDGRSCGRYRDRQCLGRHRHLYRGLAGARLQLRRHHHRQ